MKTKKIFRAAAAFGAFALSQQALAVINISNTVSGGAANFISTAVATTTNTNLSDANFHAGAPQVDHVWDYAWFWRLAGDTREFQFSTVGAVDSSVGNSGTRTYATGPFAGAPFSAVFSYLLTDGPVVGQALLNTTLTITNTSANAITISLFNYLDADVAGAANDTGVLAGDTATITDAGGTFMQYQGIGATGAQGGVFGGTPGSLLLNAAVDNLTGGYPQNNVDFCGAFQWDLVIGAGQSATIFNNVSINQAVPAPGALALLGLAGLVGRSRRRRV
ncbi:MAG: hypothetical protein L0Y44_05720 [Phycisphaerales bacterium]|nr:hypothetical protein [Phycisphaerales bacterium]MCI0630136.1 hypothetical protein [Phycisphaerales bacterium]MCI0675935.1 hypothetical protein [Phycisphaerales bacterium]